MKCKNIYEAQSYEDHYCPVCQNKNVQDTQSHLLDCEKLKSDNIVVSDLPDYEQLFSDDEKEQVMIIKLLKNHYDKRQKLMKEDKRTKK